MNKLINLINTKNSGVYFDKDNLNQLIIPVINEKENDLDWKIEKIRNTILEIESDKIDEISSSIKNEINSNDENTISLAEANIKNNKSNKKRTYVKRTKAPKLKPPATYNCVKITEPAQLGMNPTIPAIIGCNNQFVFKIFVRLSSPITATK